MAKIRRRAVGILTGGRDSPGLRAAVAAVSCAAAHLDWDVFGIEGGFDGLVNKRVRRLAGGDVRGILASGGPVFGTHRADPFAYPTRRGRLKIETDRSADLVRNFQSLGLAGLVAVGGKGTLALAERLHRRGIPIVGVPKTIENDVAQTAACLGFDSAVATAADVLAKLEPELEAGEGAIVVEVAGRHAGWVALHAGLAAVADVVLVPEIPFRVDRVCAALRPRALTGRECALVVAAEGASPVAPVRRGRDAPTKDPVAGDLASALAAQLAKPVRRIHVTPYQQGGPASSADLLLGARFGAAAMRLVDEGLFGNMVALKPPAVVAVPLHQVLGKVRPVPLDSDLFRAARDLGIGLGE